MRSTSFRRLLPTPSLGLAALLAMAAFVAPGCRHETTSPAPASPRLEWFADQKVGLLVHWGIYSVWGAVESWPIEEAEGYGRVDGFPPWDRTGHDLERFRREYFALAEQFDPVEFDPEAWASAARDAGMRYLLFTAKHHDGFAMWDTAAGDFGITHPPSAFAGDPRADVLRAVFDAFRAEGIAVGIHVSKPDWHSPDYWVPDRPRPNRLPNYEPSDEPERWQRFVASLHAQIEELMRGYGRIDILELDGGWIRAPRYDIDIDGLIAMARSFQPDLLVADRAVGGRYEEFVGAEWRVPEKPLPAPWELQVPVGWQMSFDLDDHYRPMSELIGILVETVAKGGNLALGVGPKPDGTLPPEALDRMKQLGAWLRINGEAIYGSRMAEPYRDGDVYFTSGREATYAILQAGESGAMPDAVSLPLPGPAGGEVRMLGVGSPLSWQVEGGRLRVTIPEAVRASPPSPWAWVLRIPRAGPS